jgi:electron transfer flavoprotein alpha subunit
MNKILVFAEQRNNEIKKITFENITLARRLSSAMKIDFTTVLIGWNVSSLSTQLARHGAENIVLYQDEKLALYNPEGYARLLAAAVSEQQANLLILGATALGKDLAPRVATQLKAALASDCIALDWEEGNLKIIRPMYAGKVQATIRLKSKIKIVTVRPNIYPAVEFPVTPKITEKTADAGEFKSRIMEIISGAKDKLDVTEADIIVSGGRGMKDPQNFHLITALAEKLGAAQGASRAVVDAGWRPYAEQVGQTGKTVSPTLYIAVGISGAIQHLAGMSSSKYIVAINKDPDAPIFKVADYGIIGDALEILPELLKSL